VNSSKRSKSPRFIALQEATEIVVSKLTNCACVGPAHWALSRLNRPFEVGPFSALQSGRYNAVETIFNADKIIMRSPGDSSIIHHLKSCSPAKSIKRYPRLTKILAISFAALLGVPASLYAGNLYIPNSSFESTATQFADPRVDSWEKAPQPSTFDTNTFGAWDNLAGVFLNPASTNAGSIDNAAGNQLAYLFSYPQNALFQDYSSTDWSSSTPNHAFYAPFQVGRSYTLTVGLTSSSQEPLTPGATLLLSLYYRDASSNLVTVGSTTVTYDTNVFTNLTHLIDFQVKVPVVQPSDAWANQHIGIQFESIVAPNLIGGVWDLDNVRLTENIAVPNFSFESVATQFADPRIDSWQKPPQPVTFDTNLFGAWDNLAGVFLNPPPTNAGYIDNADGQQLAYLFAYPQMAIFQDYSSIDWSNSTPTHAFNAKFTAGKGYVLTVGLTSSTQEPLNDGSTLLLSLYYRDSSSSTVSVAVTTVTYQTNVFTNLTHLLDFQVTIPVVRPTDPWAGQNIGIMFESIVAPNLIGGVWDLDNVRLSEMVPTALTEPRVVNQQMIFTLLSEPGLAFELQSSTNLAQTVGTWVSVGSLTNLTGATSLTNTAADANQRFYRARAL